MRLAETDAESVIGVRVTKGKSPFLRVRLGSQRGLISLFRQISGFEMVRPHRRVPITLGGVAELVDAVASSTTAARRESSSLSFLIGLVRVSSNTPGNTGWGLSLSVSQPSTPGLVVKLDITFLF